MCGWSTDTWVPDADSQWEEGDTRTGRGRQTDGQTHTHTHTHTHTQREGKEPLGVEETGMGTRGE